MLNKKFAEVGITHGPRPLRQNRVIIHGEIESISIGFNVDYNFFL
jgi:hypothetical protein